MDDRREADDADAEGGEPATEDVDDDADDVDEDDIRETKQATQRSRRRRRRRAVPVDPARLIAAVRRRPALYDVAHPGYMHRARREALWEEVADAVHGVEWRRHAKGPLRRAVVTDLVKKWRNIKDCYRKEVHRRAQNESSHTQYVHFDRLSFLGPILARSATRNGADSPYDGPKTVPTAQKPLERALANVKRPEVIRFLKETLLSQKKATDKDDGGNRAFLMSFVPAMNAMTSDMVIETRYQVTNIFRNIRNDSTKHDAMRRRKRRNQLAKPSTDDSKTDWSTETEDIALANIKCELK